MLSTATPIPNFLAAAISAGRSATSRQGLVGDSNQTSAAPFMAAITSSVLTTSTNRTSNRPLAWKEFKRLITPLYP